MNIWFSLNLVLTRSRSTHLVQIFFFGLSFSEWEEEDGDVEAEAVGHQFQPKGKILLR